MNMYTAGIPAGKMKPSHALQSSWKKLPIEVTWQGRMDALVESRMGKEGQIGSKKGGRLGGSRGFSES